MKNRPLLLDLFCGAGGAAMGYYRAGFDIVGIDHHPQPNYPFPFAQLAWDDVDLAGFDVVHASPPCQGYSTANQKHYAPHPKLIAAVRDQVDAQGVCYVIENVVGASNWLRAPVLVCGGALGLGTWRHRLFESSASLTKTGHDHKRPNVPVYGPLDGRRLWTRVDGSELRAAKTLEQASHAMGIDWMTWNELREAVPPAYTEYLGRQIIKQL
tara:strand:+ start:987 stop:1622 length:636 start_codon:yes stop_codon:yes gene_type:complete